MSNKLKHETLGFGGLGFGFETAREGTQAEDSSVQARGFRDSDPPKLDSSLRLYLNPPNYPVL